MSLSVHRIGAASGAAAPGAADGPERALHERVTTERRAVAPAVLQRWGAYLDELHAPEPVRAGLRAIAAGAPVIVTGQQAGLLTGPLLTLLKAARAISLARALAAASGRPVVPVFWIPADDHDLDEIHHTFVVNRAGEVQKLRLELGDARGAAGEVAVPEGARALLEELWQVGGIDAAALPLAPFLPQAGDSLATWFARCLLELFGEQGLVPFEPELLGETVRPVFAQALRDDGAIGRALQEGTDALAARGIEAPLPVEDEPPLFLIEPGHRTRVRRDGDGFVVGARRFTRDELLARATTGVPRLSGNVALRTLLQAAGLPALAYVAGPTEAKYYAQLEPLHGLFDLPFPAVIARPSATVLSTAAARALRKLGVPPAELFARLDARATATAATPPLLARGDALRAELGQWTSALLAESPAMQSAAARRTAQLLQGFDGLLERARATHAEGTQHAELRWSQLAALARPRGRPQDRSLNGLPFLAEQGRALLTTFLELRGEPLADGSVPHWLIAPSGAEETAHG